MNTRLTRYLLPLAAAASLLTLGGCATAPDVRVDYDRTADFTAYKTFAVASPLGTDRGGYQSVVSQPLKTASMYTAWPMYADPTTVSQYKEGTLNIDIVDAARKQLVWEGVVTDSVTQKALDNAQAAIDPAVAAAFAKCPIPGPTKAK